MLALHHKALPLSLIPDGWLLEDDTLAVFHLCRVALRKVAIVWRMTLYVLEHDCFTLTLSLCP
jgi:hypothetical protein